MSGPSDADRDPSDVDPDADAEREEPVVSCELQGGTLSVYGDHVHVERSRRSMFEDKTIPMDAIEGVEYSSGIVTGHVQIRQDGMDHDTGGLFSHPVDENTLFFPRNRRPAAREARDAILDRISGASAGRGSRQDAEQ